MQVGKSPDTGIRNLSIHRMLVLGKDRLSLWAPADHHLGRMILMAEEKKKGLEVATAVGVDPAIVVGSQARVPFGIDEFHIAGALRGAPVKLTKCETIDVEVPAFAEVVIEGVTIPGERVADGPYGEYPGCYSEAKQAPVLKVTAITMRNNPIWQTALTGMPVTENHTLIEYGNAAVVYREVKKIVPEVRGVNMTPGGTFRHHVVVSIKKRAENEGRNVILASPFHGHRPQASDRRRRRHRSVRSDAGRLGDGHALPGGQGRNHHSKSSLARLWILLVPKRGSPPVWVSTLLRR